MKGRFYFQHSVKMRAVEATLSRNASGGVTSLERPTDGATFLWEGEMQRHHDLEARIGNLERAVDSMKMKISSIESMYSVMALVVKGMDTRRREDEEAETLLPTSPRSQSRKPAVPKKWRVVMGGDQG